MQQEKPGKMVSREKMIVQFIKTYLVPFILRQSKDINDILTAAMKCNRGCNPGTQPVHTRSYGSKHSLPVLEESPRRNCSGLQYSTPWLLYTRSPLTFAACDAAKKCGDYRSTDQTGLLTPTLCLPVHL